MDIASRIAQAREKLGLSQSALGRALGVSSQSVQSWEKGRSTPKNNRLDDVAEALKVTPEWLTFGVTETPDGQPAHVQDNSSEHRPTNSNEEMITIPFLKEEVVEGSNDEMQIIENPGKSLTIPNKILSSSDVDIKNAAAITVYGNSMEPMLYDGSIACIDRSQNTIRDGSVYALDHGGMLWLRVAYRKPGGGMTVKSFNDERYPEETYDAEYCSKYIRILGRVFWYSGQI